MLKKIGDSVSRYGNLFQYIGLPVLKPVHESPNIVLTLFDDHLEFAIWRRRMLLQILVQIPGVERHASVNDNIPRSSLEDHRDFVGRADNWDDTFGILYPYEDFSLGMWIATIDLVEDDTGLPGVCCIFYK